MPFHEQPTKVIVLNPVSAAATANATSAALDLSGYDVPLLVECQVGAITGTIDWKIQDCDTSGGTYADVTGLTVPQITTANKINTIVVDPRGVRRFIKLVGTIVTGPVLVAASLSAFKKYR